MMKPALCALACAALASLSACATATSVEQRADASVATASASGPGDRMLSGRDLGVRSAVVAPNAAAATAHPLATQVALDVMKDGGTAVDAAIAANAMLGLVEPTGNGIGGDLFALVWDPETQELYGYNGSGRSPRGATLADMQAAADKHEDGEGIPPFGAAPVSVPGTVDGWFALHDRFGSLPMGDILQPTIDYGRNGAPIPEVIAYYWGRNETRLAEAHDSGMLEEFANAKATFFDPSPREGGLFRNPDLANTLSAIADGGRDAFYTGTLARTMDRYMARIGGFMRYADLAAHEGEWIEPVCVTYRDEVRLCEIGPNTQGVAALQMLQMLERFDLRSMGWGSADALMAQVEAKRLAFADRALGYSDSAFSGLAPDWYVREGYNAQRGRLIDLSKPMATVPAGSPSVDIKLQDGDTTYLSVTDASGMMVSLIQSNYRGMGSGLVPDGLGFMLQDRGQLFSLDPDHPNVFEPGKRPFHTIIPGFAYRNAGGRYEPWLSFGLMGGGMQPQGHVQIILNLVDYDMGLQEAGDAARWEHRGGCEPTDDLSGSGCESELGTIWLESGIPAATRAELERRGYAVRCCQANAGGYQAIMRDFDSGAWIAATEMRKDGSADGY
ncbi:gamma-glutamyltransferase family protein [uncultured Algimonas sp.]|uniref:gamma-glutamyltransferase family protein n=1 Tax=uncultured Algimonas sp. TaxID=1547920 RepID=UPI00262E5E45|nr:gamma-glutamyltransferase family protein [uncultured Algimonas sp.]